MNIFITIFRFWNFGIDEIIDEDMAEVKFWGEIVDEISNGIIFLSLKYSPTP